VFESIKRRPRRAAKVGIAVVAVVAAGGAIFASQAGASPLFGKKVGFYSHENIMLNAPSGVGCARVVVDAYGTRFGSGIYGFTGLGWKPGWNSTGMVVPVGSSVHIWLHSRSCTVVGETEQNASVFTVQAGRTSDRWGMDAFLDASHGTVIKDADPGSGGTIHRIG
jgi:hypothetical protein